MGAFHSYMRLDVRTPNQENQSKKEVISVQSQISIMLILFRKGKHIFPNFLHLSLYMYFLQRNLGEKISLHIKWIQQGISLAGMLAAVLIMNAGLYFVSCTLGLPTYTRLSHLKCQESSNKQRALRGTHSLKSAGCICIHHLFEFLGNSLMQMPPRVVFLYFTKEEVAGRGQVVCFEPAITMVTESQGTTQHVILHASNTRRRSLELNKKEHPSVWNQLGAPALPLR